MTTTDLREAARIALDNARWEVNHWARVIAEGRLREDEHYVYFIATRETHRRYAEAIAAESVAFAAWQAAETQEVTA